MTFSTNQLKALTAKLDRRQVRTRRADGRELSYVEGWFVLAEANAIFGFSGWDRETAHFERLFERVRGETTQCAYLARVRVRVRAGKRILVREGTGIGSASSRDAADAHDRAAKAAETDATKRALATFGNRFGLCLYDRERNGVSPKESLTMLAPDGSVFASALSPEGFCGAMRQLLERLADPGDVSALAKNNAESIEKLRTLAPNLLGPRNEHYADILRRLLFRRMMQNESQVQPPAPPDKVQLAPSRIAIGPRIDKSLLRYRSERRQRDKAHVRNVGTVPCLICQSLPSHGHHVTYAQDRGLSLKVSDEYVVPLCAEHHNAVHRSGAEQSWWASQGIDPLPIAKELWLKSRAELLNPALRNSIDQAVTTIANALPPAKSNGAAAGSNAPSTTDTAPAT